MGNPLKIRDSHARRDATRRPTSPRLAGSAGALRRFCAFDFTFLRETGPLYVAATLNRVLSQHLRPGHAQRGAHVHKQGNARFIYVGPAALRPAWRPDARVGPSLASFSLWIRPCGTTSYSPAGDAGALCSALKRAVSAVFWDRRRSPFALRNHGINEAKLHGLLRRHEVVTFLSARNLLGCLPCVVDV